VRSGIAALGIARGLAGRALDLVLPPLCLACNEIVSAQATVCGACWTKLNFIAPPLCIRCGMPFAFETESGAICGACVASPPVFARARSALVYDETSRSLILGFKHGDRTHSAAAFGNWLRRAGGELLADTDLVVPVPLHRWRLFRRRFNQAALLAHAVARDAGLRCAPDLLVRRHRTPSQAGLSRSGRQRNVKGAFAVRPSRGSLVADARILLVDDVLTTGSTVSECARVLLRTGAARVDVLTLARAPGPGG
jgi:ComF family protein